MLFGDDDGRGSRSGQMVSLSPSSALAGRHCRLLLIAFFACFSRLGGDKILIPPRLVFFSNLDDDGAKKKDLEKKIEQDRWDQRK